MKSGKKQSRGSSKSNTAVLFNRYVWLVDTIYRAGRITFEEINERWLHSSLNDTEEDLPLKTFHNHKNAIQQMFDINIESWHNKAPIIRCLFFLARSSFPIFCR